MELSNKKLQKQWISCKLVLVMPFIGLQVIFCFHHADSIFINSMKIHCLFLKQHPDFLLCLHISECQLSLELTTDQLQVRLFIDITGNIHFSVPTKVCNCTAQQEHKYTTTKSHTDARLTSFCNFALQFQSVFVVAWQ